LNDVFCHFVILFQLERPLRTPL